MPSIVADDLPVRSL